MCGVAGILRFDDQPVERSTVERMTRSISHRGPDGEGFHIESAVGLGHCRLAIRDLSDAGSQPMSDDRSEIWVSFNGEIYNDADLRRDLARTGYRFRSNCDAEVLPIGWRTWGERLFDRLEGMFAMAIWDTRSRTLVLARDGVGIKPLYYTRSDNFLLFASEIKAILASGALTPRVDHASFHEFLASGYPPPDMSLLAAVGQVRPGCVMTIRDSQISEYRYWQPVRRPTIHSLVDALPRIEQTLTQVTMQMRVADVPTGLLLSSGIDSAVLAFLAPSALPCYTAAFNEQSHDESHDASQIATLSRNVWHRIPVADGTQLTADFEAMVDHVDGQLADSSALALFAISRAIGARLKVALAGDGADEFFAGYPTYRASIFAARILPLVPRALAAAMASKLAGFAPGDESRLPWHDKAARFAAGIANPFGQPHAEWRRIAMAPVLSLLYGPAMQALLERDPLQRYRASIDEADGDLIDRCLVADQRHYLPADMLVKVDRMSMAHGLEIRVPYLDRRVMDLAGSLDASLLLDIHGVSKRLLRELLRKLGCPDRLVRARKKGFNVPVAQLLRNELRPLAERVLDRDAASFAPLLRPDAVRAIWGDHRDRRANHSYLLWTLMVWGIWSTRNNVRVD